MVKLDKKTRKENWFTHLSGLLDEYTKILVVGADNVGSLQMAKIRLGLRGKGVLLMGKNTMMRKILKAKAKENPNLSALLPQIVMNVGLIFTNEEFTAITDVLNSNKVAAAARAGAEAPVSVKVPAGPTGLEPTMTAFFQALNIPTKINKGQIEILNDVELIQKGDKVGSSEVVLLNKLNIKPFAFGMEVISIYDNGSLYSADILSITDDDIAEQFMTGVKRITLISLAIGFPTLAALPHFLSNSFKNCLAIHAATDYKFERAEKFLAGAAAAAASAPAGGGGGAAPAAAAAPLRKRKSLTVTWA
eukprot:JP446563.1.p1 GENE.JP446563.1~~JP446563.1.p1  ORF type:complete len:305 (-),score=140.71 JP446563.1:57-971(-)